MSSIPFYKEIFIIILDLPSFVIFFLFVSTPSEFSSYSLFKRGLILSSSLFLCVSLIFYDNFSTTVSPNELFNNRWDGYSRTIRKYGFLTFLLLDSWNSQKPKLEYSTRIVKNKGILEQKQNFIVIQVESLESRILETEYQGEPVMPFLNSLSKKCTFFPYTLSYHMGGATSDAEFSILNSVEPLIKFPAIKLRNESYENSIVKKLSQSGYKTVVFHNNIGSFFNRDHFYPQMGFSHFFTLTSMNLPQRIWGASDEDTLNFALQKLQMETPPFFYFIITMSSHEPFEMVRTYYSNPRFNGISDKKQRNYFLSLNYVDKQLEHFLNNFFRTPQASNTYIIIYGDHSSGFGNSNYPPSSYSNKETYFEFVPMLLVSPTGNKPYKEEKFVASFLDVGPTILLNSGIPFKVFSDGQNLLEPIFDSAIPLKGQTFSRRTLFELASMND
jgi:phosphoglycerol transferase MdoB-like AlkP superfamily enzyme